MSASPGAVARVLERLAARLPQDGSIDATEADTLLTGARMLDAIERHRDGLRAMIAALAVGGTPSDHADQIRTNPFVRELIAQFPDAHILSIAPIAEGPVMTQDVGHHDDGEAAGEGA